MANTSILAAFERMWQHVVAKISTKADVNHVHDDRYYTESEIDTKLSGKAPSSHTHAISDVTNLQSTLDGKAGKKVDGQTTTLDGISYVGGTNAEVFNDYEANVATGAYSHAEGCYNKATGDYSHAEGAATTASGYAGHTEGYQTKALGASSHAEGKNTAATGQTAHAEGNSSTMLPDTITPNSSVSDVETAWNSTKFTLARGIGSHAEGSNTLALSTDDHSEGYETVAKGGYSHAQGYKTVASGGRAHAEGQGSVASGNDSHAEGAYTIAAGDYQHVQGKYNVEDATGKYAHIVGGGNTINSRSNINTLDWNGNVWFKGDVYVGGTGQDDGEKLLSGSDVVDNLLSTSTDLPLSANQGRLLNDKIDSNMYRVSLFNLSTSVTLPANDRGEYTITWTNDPTVTRIATVNDIYAMGARSSQSNGYNVHLNYYLSEITENGEYIFKGSVYNLTNKSYTTNATINIILVGPAYQAD